MDFKNRIGKIKEYNENYGVGKIITESELYDFTVNDLSDNINVGDLVKFKGEKVHDQNKAFFIKKINNNYILNNNIIKSKIYKNN